MSGVAKHPAEVLKRPLLTEKGTAMAEQDNWVIFEVALSANKLEIRQAVEQLYGVKVTKVGTQVVRGKIKRVGRSVGKRANWKKALVKLAEGSTIDFFMAS